MSLIRTTRVWKEFADLIAVWCGGSMMVGVALETIGGRCMVFMWGTEGQRNVFGMF